MKALILLVCVLLTACTQKNKPPKDLDYVLTNYSCTGHQWNKAIIEADEIIRVTGTNVIASHHLSNSLARNCIFKGEEK